MPSTSHASHVVPVMAGQRAADPRSAPHVPAQPPSMRPSADMPNAQAPERTPERLGREQREVRLALAAQHGQVDLDARDPARLPQPPRLRLDRLRRQDAATRTHRRVEPDPLEVAAQLLDRLDRRDALDLDRDPAVLAVAAHEVDRADGGRPPGPDEPKALAAALRRRRQRLLEVPLDAVLLERRRL